MTCGLTATVLIFIHLNSFGTSQGQAPNPGQPNGPWNHDLYVFETDSAQQFSTSRVLVERGGVPALLRDQWERLVATFQWFPFDRREAFDRIAVMFSYDDGKTWGRPQPIEVAEWPNGFMRPCDPTLVQLDDGCYRLYFTSSGPGERSPAAYSAISNDAIHFTFEPGRRFGVDGEMLLDCAVARLGKTWHYFAPIQREVGRGYHAVSEDGLNFERLDDVTVPGDRQWLGCVIATEGSLRFFGSGRDGAWSAVSADGSKWQIERSANRTGADPGVAPTRSGGYVMIATGPLRADAQRIRPPLPPTQPGNETHPRQRDQDRPPVDKAAAGTTDFSADSSTQTARQRTQSSEQTQRSRGAPIQRADGLLDLNMMWSRGQAIGKGPVRFTHSPMRLADIEILVPYGLVVGGHVTPIDHQYYYPKPVPPSGEHFSVHAPADGFIVTIGHRVRMNATSERQRDYDDYQLVIEHSSTFYTNYDLLTKLDKAILDKLDQSVRDKFAKKIGGSPHQVRIRVKAGQVIGKVGGRSLDFGVVNSEVTLKGFLTPARYGHYAWRIHTVDPFDYFDEPLRGQLLALNPRKAEPRGGKIDYDIDGRLVGNWFKEGTGGYDGNRDPRGYWMGHLAFVYHHFDPSKIIVSIGDFDGRPRQFMVSGNAPDPADVTRDSGPVKYELIQPNINSSGIEMNSPNPQMFGTVLVELLEGRRLRFQVFVGRSAKEVREFNDAAIYER